MPYKDTVKLTIDRKAKIVAEKQLGISNVKTIAALNNVSEDTVYRTARTASPEVLAKAEEYKPAIIAQAKRNVQDGLKVMHERMFLDRTPLKEITGAVKVSHDIVQIQTGQPTQINGTADSQSQKLTEFIEFCLSTPIIKEGIEVYPSLEQALWTLENREISGVEDQYRLEWVAREKNKLSDGT